MKNRQLITGIIAALLCALPLFAAQPELKYVVIISRHGVRSPTWDAAHLNEYSTQPWPSWGVQPGDLTPHGRALIKLMGAYYRDWLLDAHLFKSSGCEDAGQMFIWADVDQRTLETGRAFAESMLPGCGLALPSQPGRHPDPLFSGIGTPDPALSLKAVRDRLGPDPQKLLADHRAALDVLDAILTGGKAAPDNRDESPSEIGASLHGKSVDLDGPLATGSSLSEDLLLEYLDGMSGTDLGWGRLSKEDLFRVLEVHRVYADLIRRTPYLARARGSNLLEHALLSIEQAASGKAVPGAEGHPGDHLLVLVGHDTNLSNISGMLGLSWHLPGYQPDDTPPGGALVFSLWRDPDSGKMFVRTQYVAQTPEQMRNAVPLTLSAPPEMQDVQIPGCDVVARGTACSWADFKAALEKSIDPAFTSIETTGSGTP